MIYKLMKSRRSIRRFTAEVPSKDLVEKLIEAAITAPSASNKQPWRFIAVTNRDTIARMSSAIRGTLDRIVQHLNPDYRHIVLSYGDYFTRFEGAGLVVVPIYRSIAILSHLVEPSLGVAERESLTIMERDSGLISVSLATQNLLLMAHELGLGASCMTGPLLALKEIHDILRIQPLWTVMALVPIGYPDEQPDPTSRKPPIHVLTWLE
jgi:nitroreductase